MSLTLRLGTFSALRRPSPVATQYKRQAEMYGQALRTLSRAARRGDARAAITAIELRDKANADGFSPGGIQRQEDFQANVFDREQSMMQRNADLRNANEIDRQTGTMQLTREPVNPKATVGAGRGRPLKTGDRAAPTSSWDSDGNGVPNSLQRPAETPQRLTRRRSFLDRAALDLPNTYPA